jgi:hypothetical protein
MEPTIGDLKWDIIKWMLKGEMYHKAGVYLEEVIAPRMKSSCGIQNVG